MNPPLKRSAENPNTYEINAPLANGLLIAVVIKALAVLGVVVWYAVEDGRNSERMTAAITANKVAIEANAVAIKAIKAPPDWLRHQVLGNSEKLDDIKDRVTRIETSLLEHRRNRNNEDHP